MNFYAVIDTNVLVSAMLKENSVPRKILDLAFGGKIIPLLNDEILAEYEEVISRPKFKNTQESIDFFMNGMKNHGIFIDAKDFEDELPDPKDKIFYCVLMTAREDVDAYLVTGNLKHFPQKIYIVTPRELLDIVESDGD